MDGERRSSSTSSSTGTVGRKAGEENLCSSRRIHPPRRNSSVRRYPLRHFSWGRRRSRRLSSSTARGRWKSHPPVVVLEEDSLLCCHAFVVVPDLWGEDACPLGASILVAVHGEEGRLCSLFEASGEVADASFASPCFSRHRPSSRSISTRSSSAVGRRSGPAGALSFPTFDPTSPECSPECHCWSPPGGRRRPRRCRHLLLVEDDTTPSPSPLLDGRLPLLGEGGTARPPASSPLLGEDATAARGRRRRHCWLREEDATASSSRPPLRKEKAASAATTPLRKDATRSPTPPSDPLPNARLFFMPAGSPEQPRPTFL